MRRSVRNLAVPTRIAASFSALCLACVLVCAGACSASEKRGKNEKSKSNEVELGLVVKAIEDALEVSQQNPVAGFPPLQSATVKVQTTISKDAGGKVTILVFNVGGKYGTQNATSMTLELKPPSPKGPEIAPSSVNVEDIKDALAKQIQAAKVGYLSALARAKSLKTDKVEISVQFEVSTEVSGGVDTGKLLPIGISADGKWTRDTGNTITLVFAR
jgi:hypothetical protein